MAMVRNYLMLFIFCCIMTPNLLAQSFVQGMVVDEDGKIEGNVMMNFYKDGFLKRTTKTNSDGNYRVKLESGTYQMKLYKIGFPKIRIDNFILFEGMEKRIDFKIEEFYRWNYIVTEIYDPLVFEENKTSLTKTFNCEKILKEPTRNIKEIILSTPGVSFSQ